MSRRGAKRIIEPSTNAIESGEKMESIVSEEKCKSLETRK